MTPGIPVHLTLADGRLVAIVSDPRITASGDSQFTLSLSTSERIVFEALDFIEDGIVYTVRAQAGTSTWPRFQMSGPGDPRSGCRSPVIDAPATMSIVFTAKPETANDSACSTSTTHTTIIIKKSKSHPDLVHHRERPSLQ